MVWVKGELLTDIASASVDPTAQMTRDVQPRLFDRLDWFRRIIRHSPRSLAPLVARAASDGKLAWLMLASPEHGQLAALTNWYTMAFAPVFAGEPDDVRKQIMLTAIAKRLAAMRDGASRVSLEPVARGDATSAMLAGAFRKAGWLVFVDQVSTSWTANVAGLSFDEYWATRPGQLRSTVKRKGGKADFDIIIYDRFDEHAWAEYEQIYADSWKSEEGSAEFLRETALHEGDAGCLRLGLCSIDGVAVAAQYWTVEGGVAHIHKLAYRQSAKEFSPGTLLSEAMFRHVIDVDHVQTIDFGTGDDAYKADWMDESMPLDRVRAYHPRRLHGLTGAARAFAGTLVARARRG